jgi:hypothetical protein
VDAEPARDLAHPEDVGHLAVVQIVEEAEHDGLPRLLVQPTQGVLDAVPELRPASRIGDRPRWGRSALVTAAARRRPDAHSKAQSDPAAEPRTDADPGRIVADLLRQADQGVLDEVVGLRRVRAQPSGVVGGIPDLVADEAGEGVLVAARAPGAPESLGSG